MIFIICCTLTSVGIIITITITTIKILPQARAPHCLDHRETRVSFAAASEKCSGICPAQHCSFSFHFQACLLMLLSNTHSFCLVHFQQREFSIHNKITHLCAEWRHSALPRENPPTPSTSPFCSLPPTLPSTSLLTVEKKVLRC